MSPLEHFEQNKANIFWLYLEHSANIFTIWITLQIYSLFGALCKYIHYLEHSASIFRYIWSTLQIYLLFWSLCKYISLYLEHSANIFTISISLQIYFVIFGALCKYIHYFDHSANIFRYIWSKLPVCKNHLCIAPIFSYCGLLFTSRLFSTLIFVFSALPYLSFHQSVKPPLPSYLSFHQPVKPPPALIFFSPAFLFAFSQK